MIGSEQRCGEGDPPVSQNLLLPGTAVNEPVIFMLKLSNCNHDVTVLTYSRQKVLRLREILVLIYKKNAGSLPNSCFIRLHDVHPDKTT